MSVLAQLTETFEVPTVGDVISTSNSIFTTMAGNPSTTPTIVSDAHIGSKASRWATTGDFRSGAVSGFTPLSLLWYDFYLKVVTLPTGNVAFTTCYSGATKLMDAQINPTGAEFYTVRIRSGAVGSTTLWTSTSLARNEWHRIALKVQPNNATGLQCRIYSGANLDTMTPSQDSDPQPIVIALPTLDEVRFGVVGAATMDIRIDQIRADNATQPVIGGGGGSTDIINLTEGFETPADGVAISTSNSQADQVSGTAPVAYAADPYSNTKSARFNPSAAFSILRFNFTAVPLVWFKFALKIVSLPSGNTGVAAWYAPDGTTRIGDFQVMADGKVRLRDGTSQVWVSTGTPTLGQWHEFAILCNTASATGHRVRRYSGADRGTTSATEDSNPQDRTISAPLGVGVLTLGVLSAESFEIRIDRVRGDSASEPAGAAPPGSTLAVSLGADQVDKEPYDPFTLTASVTGGTAPYTAVFTPSGGAPALTGTGLTRQGVAGAAKDGVTHTYSVEITDNVGATATDSVNIIVIEHNRFDLASSAWRPINRLNRVGSQWV